MKNYLRTLIISGFIALYSAAVAAEGLDVKHIPDGSRVSMSGNIETIQNEREFTLRNESGSIPVKVGSDESFTLEEGQKVTVEGTLNRGMIFGSSIKADVVDVHKGLVKAVDDAIEGNTNISLEGAKRYDSVKQLPDKGFVKISGTVIDVDNEKKFTLKDTAGNKININVRSSESVSLVEGAQVTVLGYVNKKILGKDIAATRVVVISDVSPTAGR